MPHPPRACSPTANGGENQAIIRRAFASHGVGLNSTVRLSRITLGTPLSPGAAVNLRFRLGVMMDGSFRFLVNVEALP
ncbi:MAG TPA: hypothetical protein VEX70_05320 [Pyrinomonadaceae bacterium]|nr:hypothetical protein [Pyrinomonadaceae bacterium]